MLVLLGPVLAVLVTSGIEQGRRGLGQLLRLICQEVMGKQASLYGRWRKAIFTQPSGIDDRGCAPGHLSRNPLGV